MAYTKTERTIRRSGKIQKYAKALVAALEKAEASQLTGEINLRIKVTKGGFCGDSLQILEQVVVE